MLPKRAPSILLCRNQDSLIPMYKDASLSLNALLEDGLGIQENLISDSLIVGYILL